MGLLLNQFRDDLRRDYLSNGWRDSFLFRYLKQEREEEKGQEKKDSYSQLERAFSNIHSEDGRRAYFLLALGLLEKSRKPLLPGNGKKGRRMGKPFCWTMPAIPGRRSSLAQSDGTERPAACSWIFWNETARIRSLTPDGSNCSTGS